MMKHLFNIALAIFLVLPHAVYSDSTTCSLIPQALDAAEHIRGLKKKHMVPCFLRDKEEVKKYLVTEIKRQLTTERLISEAFVYKTLGIVPKDFDYEKEIVDLYISQLGGYYDPQKQEYVMAAWLPAAMQPTIAVHELTHALQDQYFGLKYFLDEKKYTSDELLSRSALVEGDATAVMTDYQRNLLGMPSISKEESVESILLQTVLGSFVSESLQKAPSALRNMLIFPYASGLRFVHKFLKEGEYKAVNKLFSSPPKSTEEILHPEKYGREGEFEDVTEEKLRSLAQLSEGKVSHTDRLGEFFLSTWLSTMGVPNSPNVASEWGGDRVFVIDTNIGKKLYWVILWDSSEKAREFNRMIKVHISKLNLSLIQSDEAKTSIIASQ